MTWPSVSVSKEACPVHALVEAVCVPTITSVLESARSAAAFACAAADWAEEAVDWAEDAADWAEDAADCAEDAADWAASAVVDADDYLFLYAGDGQYKGVTIGIGIQLGIYDMNGHLLMLREIPVAEPADVIVEIDEKGNQKLVDALPSAAGVYFHARPKHIYFYVFFDSKTRKIAKGGKFVLR